MTILLAQKTNSVIQILPDSLKFVFSFFFPRCRKLISCLKQALIYTGENDKNENLKSTMTVILQSLLCHEITLEMF